MQSRKRVRFVILLTATLIVGLLLGRAFAQGPTSERIPTVITGTNFGIRIDQGRMGEPVRGTLLVRIAGQWHEIQPATIVVPLATPLAK